MKILSNINIFIKNNLINNLNKKNYTTNQIAFVSDIHLEHKHWNKKYPRFNDNQLEETSNINGIAILGDIGNIYHSNYLNFISYCALNYNNVYFLTGNHEHYIKGMFNPNLNQKINDRINIVIDHAITKSNNNNIYYLNNDMLKINDKFLVGSTFWSNQSLSIKNGNPYNLFYKYINKEHDIACNFIKDTTKLIEKYNNAYNIDYKNITIMTHYPPTYLAIKYPYSKLIKSDYAKSLRYFSHNDKLLKYPIKNWLCGHSHSVYDIYANGVYVGLNCYNHPNKTDSEIKVKIIDL